MSAVLDYDRGMPSTALTELEAAALGELLNQQPCTAYVVRRSFEKSLTPTWSGSAGTIYPALERLERRKLVRSRASGTGRRRSRTLSVTTLGKSALRSWILSTLSLWEVGTPLDPLRIRIGFFGVLTPARRIRFLQRAIERLAHEITRAEAYVDHATRNRGPWQVAIGQGALTTQRARMGWLKDVLRVARRT